MVNLCKSNKTTYKATFLLFIFAHYTRMAIRTLIGLLLITCIQGCAKIAAPTGGPQDVLPPEYISGSPENRSVSFSGKQIDINFNEYIQLKDQNREVIISPPMKKKPLVRVRQKSIRITFNEDLLPSTTYTVNFGKSISDLNEGNILPDFEYVFSTGNTIDSLSVTGKVVDAFTHEPEKETPMLVMLYENLSDSAPLIEIPRYYTRSNQFGLFAINNIRPDTFRLIAVVDANNNMRYDQGLEKIAFADSLVIVNSSTVREQTFIKDTIKIITPARVSANRRDTLSVADTMIAPGRKLNALSLNLYSFKEQGSRVAVTSRKRDLPGQFSFTFNRRPYDFPEIEPLNFEADSGWVFPEPSSNNDTIIYWVTDTNIAKLDTLRLRLSYKTVDSTGLLISKHDTVRLRMPSVSGAGEGRGGARRSRDAQRTRINELQITGNISNRGTLHPNSNLLFTASRPVSGFNPDSIELSVLRDTLYVPLGITAERDTLITRRFIVSAKWDEDSQYKILLKPGTVKDIYGRTNDSTELTFSTRPLDYYGRILLNFSSYTYPMIVQVINEKKAVVKKTVVEKAGLITFEYLVPGQYAFKAIYDINNNGRWDTGDYLKQRQPERTFISGKPQQLRSNWDWEFSWQITENSYE